jgi:hypothetical protein
LAKANRDFDYSPLAEANGNKGKEVTTIWYASTKPFRFYVGQLVLAGAGGLILT